MTCRMTWCGNNGGGECLIIPTLDRWETDTTMICLDQRRDRCCQCEKQLSYNGGVVEIGGNKFCSKCSRQVEEGMDEAFGKVVE